MNIEISMRNYEGRHGHAYRGLQAKVAGQTLASDTSGMHIVEFIELALQKGIERVIAENGQAETFTVILPAGVVLGAELSVILTQKYEADPVVSSLVFG